MRICRLVRLKPLIPLANSKLLRFRCSVTCKAEAPVMEAKILTQTQRYAAGALFALALHQTQIHQTRQLNALLSLEEETIGDGASIGRTVSVSDDPGLWIHESSGLLYPVFRFLGVDDQSWKGLKETAGSSSQVRHHVGSEVMETMVACSFMASLKEGVNEEETEGVNGDKKENNDTSWEEWKRGGLIGAAALTGGTLMAITGGLAAPAIAQGLGALAPVLGGIVPAIGATGFAAAATATGSVTGSLSVAASFGAAGAGLTGTKMARRIGNIEEFEFKAVEGTYNQGRLAVGIVVSGLVFEDEDFIRPWEGYNDHLERYALWWESKNLVALSTAIQDWLTSRIALELMKEGAMLTVLNTLVAAFAMPATLVTASDIIDSRWAIAVDRSDKAGKMLAEVLLKGLQGNRPVTLIGFSLGGRVIFKCLECLAETEGNNAGLVERVVLLGAPVSIEDENWEDARKMVAGRFVNAYSTNDWTLGVAFRASLLSQGLAGIQAVNVPGIENVDVTQQIEGHSSYLWKTKHILELLELESYYPVFRKEDAEDKKPQEEKSSAAGADPHTGLHGL